MIDKKTNKLLAKSLKEKKRKPSWFARHSRKKLVEKLALELKNQGAVKAWAHTDFVSAVEKKPQTIILYTQFAPNAEEGIANKVDGIMSEVFTKYKVNIINVDTLLPVIKDTIFKEVETIF